MSNYTFSTHGMTVEFDDNSDEVLAALANAVDRALDVIGSTACGYAQDELRKSKPVFPSVSQDAIDTSELLESMTNGYKVVDDEVYIGTNVRHAPFVEYGTGKYSSKGGGDPREYWPYMGEDGKWHIGRPMMPRPFLKPAASEHTKEYREILKDSLENA